MKAITTKFHGPTDSKGSRFTAQDADGNRVTIGKDYELNSDGNHAAAALALCKKMGWPGHLISGWTKDGMVFVFAESDRIVNPLGLARELNALAEGVAR